MIVVGPVSLAGYFLILVKSGTSREVMREERSISPHIQFPVINQSTKEVEVRILSSSGTENQPIGMEEYPKFMPSCLVRDKVRTRR